MLPSICRRSEAHPPVHPPPLQAAAQMYLKRFYLLHSCMDHDPQPIALVCVYIACKVCLLDCVAALRIV